MHPDRELTFATALASHHRKQHFSPDEHAHEYYQTSLLSAIMQGVYDGTVSIGQLLKHGDFGLGTFNALDGEMVVLDGVAYRLDGEGKASVSSDSALTPYAAVINFEPTVSLPLGAPVDKEAFEDELDAMAEAKNLFYAVRFTGLIKYIKYRNVLRQDRPYKPLLEVVKTQAEFELGYVTGTILGFRCPDYAVGIGVPGYHLHFISEDRTKGGHVLDYVLSHGQIKIDHTSSLYLELPETQDFSDANLSAGASTDSILKAESN
ncbi:acetolactate decarboxylase [Ruegeria halocynthiae]|uniref:Alpha-acetolactate decarboxylase n=1 Tax=Ruegeria halocynthiae TaxID=985054 RepID=A0A1H2WL09_9RHOB|nr:acetolactate decarboxylase [Ruegeria halocynthiae]SDW80954.1 acetolactate decarboxylase [Ruegeria halocynthiae]